MKSGWSCTAQVKVADAELLTNWQRKNKEYKQRHQLNAHRESDTLARLTKFRQNLHAPAAEDGRAGGSAAAAAAVVRADAEDAAEPKKVEEEEEVTQLSCFLKVGTEKALFVKSPRVHSQLNVFFLSFLWTTCWKLYQMS